MLIARFVGANFISDAFFTAFRFPNMFRRIFGEGAFNAAFVPLFAKKLETDTKKKAVEFGSHTFSMLSLVLGVATLIAIPCMGWIMSLVAPGFKAKLDTGWVSPGQAQIVSADKTISISGAKSIYLVYEGKGKIAPELAFLKANLIASNGDMGIFQKLKSQFKPDTANGERTPLWTFRPRFALQLLSIKDLKELPTEGTGLVVVALVANEFHIRIFDDKGKLTTDLAQSAFLSGNDLSSFRQGFTELSTRERTETETEMRQLVESAIQLSGFSHDDPIAEATGGGTGFRLLNKSVVEFPLPKKHTFEALELDISAAAMPSGEQVRFQVYRTNPKTFPLTVTLARITFVYLLCMALAAHLSGVLNTVRIFGMPAAAPIILNAIFIIGLVIFVPLLSSPDYSGHVLAWCVLVAGFVQLGALWWTCHKKGYPIRLVKPTVSPEMKRLFLLMGPGIVSAGIQQINLLIGGIIASSQESAISYLYYSERIYQLPLGMVGIAFGVVLLPEITRSLRANRPKDAEDSLNRGIEYSLLITVPAAIALIVIAFPIISGVFQWGKNFTIVESLATAPALSAFALGLPGYVLIKVLQPGYFAREDTKTPMIFAGITVLTNIVFSLILFYWLRSRGIGHVGIAFATSIAAWVNVALLAFGLRKRGYLKLDKRLLDRLWRIAVCSLLMGALLFVLYQSLEDFLRTGRVQCLLSLIVLLVAGLASYGAAAITLGATTRAELRQGFRRG
jgi:putative peptidoglycan lipid II flippase